MAKYLNPYEHQEYRNPPRNRIGPELRYELRYYRIRDGIMRLRYRTNKRMKIAFLYLRNYLSVRSYYYQIWVNTSSIPKLRKHFTFVTRKQKAGLLLTTELTDQSILKIEKEINLKIFNKLG